MLPRTAKTEAPAYFYNEHLLTVEYSFSEYMPTRYDMGSSKLWLDILFVHPQHHEAVTIRVAKSTLILCQARDVIEAVVHREIRLFLQQSPIKEYGTAHTYTEVMPAQAAA